MSRTEPLFEEDHEESSDNFTESNLADQTDQSIDYAESPKTNWTFWIILIVIVVVFIGIILAIWLWKSNKSANQPGKDGSSTSSTTSGSTQPSNTDPSIPINNTTSSGSNTGGGIFGPPDQSNPSNPTNESGPEIKVSVSGFVQNSPKTKSWFHGKTLDLAPPSKGYLIATISDKKYVLTFKKIKDGTDKLIWGMCLTNYGKLGAEDNSSIVYRGCPLLWNYRTVDNNQSIECYLLARNNPIGGPFEFANVVVNREGLPIYLNDKVDITEYSSVVLMAEMDDNKRLLGYYLVNMNGDPLCFTQEDKHSDSSKLQIGMINPSVYTGQYSKLLIRFDLENITTNPIAYQNTHTNLIERRNPIKVNSLWTSTWLVNASIKPHKLNNTGLLPIILVRLNKYDYSLAIEQNGSSLEKIVKYLHLAQIDYSGAPVYIQEDSVRLKLRLLIGAEQTEIHQSQTGILHLDTEQLNPQENILQIFEDVSTKVPSRFMITGKGQTPLLLLNGSGFEDQDPSKNGVSIGVRFWNPDFYVKQRRLILRSKMRPTGIDWQYHWMKCTRCSSVFDFWYDLDDGSDFLDQEKAGRCPNSRYRWNDDYGYGHLERHDDYNYVISRGTTGWARCNYCHCLCSTEIPGFCYKTDVKGPVPHTFEQNFDLSMEFFESEMGNGRSRTWFSCYKCGVVYHNDGTNQICAVDGDVHRGTQKYVLKAEHGDRWDA